MGLGHLDNITGEIDLLVTFRFPLTATEQGEWLGRFNQAAQRFHAATRQKLKIGKISWSIDQPAAQGPPISGVHAADLVIHTALDQKGYAYLDRFSRRGGNANIGANFPPAGIPNTIVHELAHYILNVSDEYRSDWFQLEIDPEADLDALIAAAELAGEFPAGPVSPEEKRASIIPLVPGQEIPGDFSSVRVLIENDLQLRIMFFVRDSYMTTNAPFTKVVGGSVVNAVPQTDAASPVYGYESAFCSNECIMQNADYTGADSAGQLLCESNHVPGTPLNAQHELHAQSCWQTVVDTLQQRHGFDVEAAPTLIYSDPAYEQLLPQRRIAMVFDRSGSMGDDGKIQLARQAAELWLSTYLPGEYVSFTWYNDSPTTTLQLTELTGGSNTDLSNQLNVDPTGYTNIQNGLQEGLDQVMNGAPGVAAVSAVVLMTDGLHNRPVNSDARAVIGQFNNVHVPIHAIGFGNDVDMNLLDDLAEGTGGVAYSDAETGFQDAVTRIGLELRAGLVLDWYGDLGASGNGRGEPPVLKTKRTRPALLRLLADRRLIDFRLKHGGKPRRTDAASIPVLIEESSARAIFYLRRHNAKDPAWFYLLDPDDNEIDFDSLGKAYFNKHGTEQVVIEKPEPGIWHMMIVKDESHQTVNSYTALAASENPRLTVTGDTTKQNPKGAPVRIWANANWSEPLSDIDVEAQITHPNGQQSTVELHETASDLRRKGIYEGFFVPSTSGRHTGRIRFTNNGNATRALAGSHPAHDEINLKEGSSIRTASDAPRFVRHVNFYFDSGIRPRIIDNDE